METPLGPRKKRKTFNTPGEAHELTFSCYRRRAFLQDAYACQVLAETIAEARERFHFHLWGYVFMPEHVHLLLWPYDSEYKMEEILQAIKQPVARKTIHQFRIHHPEKLTGFATGQKKRMYHFWQEGGGYDKNICCVAAIQNMLEYIHGNPVRRGFVQKPEEWYWSSAGEWLSPKTGPIPIDAGTFPY